jgi:hypothetical protein
MQQWATPVIGILDSGKLDQPEAHAAKYPIGQRLTLSANKKCSG